MCLQTISADAAVPNAQAKADVAASDFAKAAELTMPIKDGGFRVGEVIVLVDTDGSLRVEKTSLATAIRTILRADALQVLESKMPGSAYVSIPELTAAGLKASYNSSDLEILIEPTVEQRPRGEVTGTASAKTVPADLLGPAHLSGFLNTYFGVAYGRGEDHSGAFEFPAVSLNGAVRWEGMVIEGEAQIDADGMFARRATRLVYDIPDDAIRLSAGDLRLQPGGFFVTPPLLGIAIERSDAALRPTRNVRPTGKRSFRVERASEVRVMVNEREVRSLRVGPGEYDLDDLPLASGTNNVRLLIKDEFGTEENVDFSILFNRTLLSPGISEWSVAAGTTTSPTTFEPEYGDGEPILTGSLRSGLSETLTASFGIQTSKQGALGSAGALTQTPLGLLGLDAAASVSNDIGLGWLLSAELDLNTARFWKALGSIHIGAEIRSEGFATSLEDVDAAGASIRVNGSLSQPLPAGFSMGVSGYFVISPSVSDESFGTSISLSRLVSPDLSLGVSGSYNSTEQDSLDDAGLAGFSLLARLNYRPSAATNLNVEYDAVSRSTTASIGTGFESGASQTSVDLDIEHLSRTESGAVEHIVEADVSHSNSRFEVNGIHTRHVERLGTTLLEARSSVNVGTAVAFADGKVAVGRPIRGAFAIIDTHESLASSDVRLDPFQDTYRATSDGWGPLIVSDIAPYAPTDLTYDVDNLPAGYDTGSGSFNLLASYKSGFALSIGSDSAVTATGILKDAENKPIAFKAGFASSSADQETKIVLFTNATGKFSAQGLKAGEWIIQLNHNPNLRYAVKIADDATGFVDLGDLQPNSEIAQ